VSAVVCHYTVGVNSIGTLGRDFTFLVDRDGDIHQGAPVDAVVYHAGEPWNHRGPGIEAEYHPAYDDVDGDGPEEDEILTEAQVASLNALVHWLHTEWGVTLTYYDGPRIRDYQGFIAHRAVIQTGDWHDDYWPPADTARIFGDDMPLSFDDLVNIANTLESVDGKDLAGTHVSNLYLLHEIIALKDAVAALAAPAAVVADVDEAAVAEAVADELHDRLTA